MDKRSKEVVKIKVNLPEDLCFAIEKGIYEQSMAVSNLAFVLYQHMGDETDEFLDSEFYNKLFDKCVRATAMKQLYERELVSMFTQGPIINYYIDTSRGILELETK